MTQEEFLKRLSEAETDPQRLKLFSKYVDALTFKYVANSNRQDFQTIQNVLSKLALHLRALSKTEYPNI